jgi:hypothetical protein
MQRDFLFVGCERGHDWQSIGGCNAGCELGDWCCCSVPVNVCSRCKDCDYGENEEAEATRVQCAEHWSDELTF